METTFDVIVIGTGLTESIAAAALAKAGVTVLHLDERPIYGGHEASMTTGEIQDWIKREKEQVYWENGPALQYFGCSVSGAGPSQSKSRQYSLSLAPSILPAAGSLITSLIESGVSKYGEFKLLQRIAVYSEGHFKDVPGSKEAIFKSRDLSLPDKRKLMRFLTFAFGDYEDSPELIGRESSSFLMFLKDVFKLDHALSKAIVYALALCSSEHDETLPALSRLRLYLRSSGRYGPSSFLVGLYGGIGELSQGFCRSCAVAGGTYILGQSITSISRRESTFKICLSDMSEEITCSMLVASVDTVRRFPHLKREIAKSNLTEEPKSEFTASGIIVINQSIPPSAFGVSSDRQSEVRKDAGTPASVDTALLVFPPGELLAGKADAAVTILVNGDGMLSCPGGEAVLYVQTQLCAVNEICKRAEDLLTPYVDATLSLLNNSQISDRPQPEIEVRFKAFFVRSTSLESSVVLQPCLAICNPLSSHLAQNGDQAAVAAESVFRTVQKALSGGEDEADGSFWPLRTVIEEDDDGE